MSLSNLSLAVVGAPYANKDGSNRQFEIKLCSPGEVVELRPEPKNPHDEHAIGVWSARGVQIGYISSERAPFVGGLMRAGRELTAIFQDEAQFGAVIRVGIDQAPMLPQRSPQRVVDEPPDFYPDEIWPDD